MNEQNIYNEPTTLTAELQEAAFEYLLLNPGSEFGDWQHGLISDYPTEVVDALGSDPEDVYASLADLWESDYTDPKTGLEQKFSEWAMSFANECSVGIYYFLVDAIGSHPAETYASLAEAKRDIKRIEARQSQKQPNPQPRPQSPAEGHF